MAKMLIPSLLFTQRNFTPVVVLRFTILSIVVNIYSGVLGNVPRPPETFIT